MENYLFALLPVFGSLLALDNSDMKMLVVPPESEGESDLETWTLAYRFYMSESHK